MFSRAKNPMVTSTQSYLVYVVDLKKNRSTSSERGVKGPINDDLCLRNY